MDDEFKLCWKNFQDNIASGFQNLYDRGDLVDVTLACDGKLLQAHKIVLAICSPYFQEIFTTNPCKHPIIILKDVSFNIMLELLEFMYQGVVNVKHTELQSFMKIGQLLQIKGLATNTTSSAASTSSEKSSSHLNAIDDESNATAHTKHPNKSNTSSNDTNVQDGNATKASNTTSGGGGIMAGSQSPARSHSQCHSTPPPPPPPLALPPAQSTTTNSPSPSPMSYVTNVLNQHNLKGVPEANMTPLLNLYQSTGSGSGAGALNSASSTSSASSLKRHLDAFSNDALSIYSRKQFRRSLPLIASEHNSSTAGDHNDHSVSDSNGGGGGGGSSGISDPVNPEDFFMPGIPHISMVESRYDLNNLKREAEQHGPGVAAAAAAALRTFGPAFNFEYNPYKSSGSSSSGGGGGGASGGSGGSALNNTGQEYPNELHMPNDYSKNFGNHMDIPQISPGEHWFQGKLEFMLSQRGKPLLVHDGHTFGIQYVRKDKKYWQCNLSRKFNCKARVTTTDTGEIIVTNNEHCHTEIRQHLRKDYQRNKVMMNALINLSTNRLAENIRRSTLGNLMANSASTSPSPVGHHLAHHQHSQASTNHHHQQQHTGHSDNNMEQSILNLGKAAAAAAAAAAASSSSLSPHRNMPMASPIHDDEADDDDDDDMRPLDCGIRSMRDAHDEKQPQQPQHNMHLSSHIAGVADNTDNWKAKLDTPLDASQ